MATLWEAGEWDGGNSAPESARPTQTLSDTGQVAMVTPGDLLHPLFPSSSLSIYPDNADRTPSCSDADLQKSP